MNHLVQVQTMKPLSSGVIRHSESDYEVGKSGIVLKSSSELMLFFTNFCVLIIQTGNLTLKVTMRAKPSSSPRSGKSNRANGKSHSSGSKINRSKGGDKKGAPDLSVLRQPVDTSISGLRQAVKGSEAGTPEERWAKIVEARKLSIQRLIQSLVHACQCRDANCSLPRCLTMKRAVQHTKICKRKAKGDCPICKLLISCICYHAKYCNETKCPVPFCQKIKFMMKQQQLQEGLQQVMNTRGSVMGSSAVSPGAQQAVVISALPAPSPQH